ncbi:hypothetical protein PIB30_048810 [Stylosanthes scabra]|uniref:Uncharacterized protein n=1 Tax=Stylosanthes scabra TaxID=79078 RepID=A0ABU6YIA6_9FABA|nr:hypothetical protein [Stylosanthes scabra]
MTTHLLTSPVLARGIIYSDSPTTISKLVFPGLTLLRRLGRSAHQNGAIAGELNISNPNPDFLDLDLELERTLRHAKQVRRRIEFENSLYSQTENLATEEIYVDSSLSDSESENFFSPTHTGTLHMAEPPRVTLRQMGGASVALENQPVRYPELNKNFELKTV